MLRTLKINNFALIKDVEIQFEKGFNVLIGETGAGKSLILSALSFVLGSKANKNFIRTGEFKILVQAVCDVNDNIKTQLSSFGIDVEDDALIIQRILTIDGKSECRINGGLVSINIVRGIAAQLVNIYAQNENIELLDPKRHLSILDEFIGEEILDLKISLKNINQTIDKIQSEMKCFGGDEALREREIDLLDYQIKDIESANLYLGEDEEIKTRLTVLNSYEKIFESVKNVCSLLSMGSDNVLTNSLSNLASVSKFDKKLEEVEDRLSSSKYEIDDIAEELSDYFNTLTFDENEYAKLDARYEKIKVLKKKYGGTIEEVLRFLKESKEKYDTLIQGEFQLSQLSKQLIGAKKEAYNICVKMNNLRGIKAREIEKSVIKELNDVGISNAKFDISIQELIPFEESVGYDSNGLDKVEFLFSANKGESPKPLAKIISGGEMSRFMLAIKNVLSTSQNLDTTLVFDEIDTGISGNIGMMVAKKIAKLSKNNQVLCITHLAQVTALADCYIKVYKVSNEDKTYTNIQYLNEGEIISYIASMQGTNGTEGAKLSARELKAIGEEYKNSLR